MTALLGQISQLALARALEGRPIGRNYVQGRGPNHGRGDDSLLVELGPHLPDGFRVHSFAEDDPILCRDHVRALAGLPPWSPRARSAGSSQRSVPPPPCGPDLEEERRRRDAQALWDEARDPRGTVVQTYLESRLLTLPDELAGCVIRFHPAMPWNHEGESLKVLSMVAIMRTIRGDEFSAIHRTALTQEGRKAFGKQSKKMLGPSAGAAIKLDADDTVTTGITVGEGIETTLAARQLGFKPAWALGSVGAIGRLPVLSGIEALTILSEDDAANGRAVEQCAERWGAAGREVLTVASKVGGDINDAITGRAAA